MQPIEVWIPGRMPGENEIIKAAKSGKGKGNAYSRLKKKWTDYIAAIFQDCQIEPMGIISLVFVWVEKNKKRDKDNITAAKKFIFDGMQQAGVIPNDGWGNIATWQDCFEINPYSPGVKVFIYDGPTINEQIKG